MNKHINSTPELFQRKAAYGLLWLAMLIFGAASSITRKLTEIGGTHLIEDRNPISFCNVLFIGNICALFLLIAIYYRQWTISNLKQISWKNWIFLTLIAILSGTLAPGLIFLALANTTVTSVVLVGRLETPLTLAFSILFLRERVNIWTIAGAAISLVGVGVTVFLQSFMGMGMAEVIRIGPGEIMTAMAALFLAISTIISKLGLEQVPLGIFSIFRTTVASILFFFIATNLYGPEHFIDAFSPFLWGWMFIYSAIIVVLGQSCWFAGLKNASGSEVSLVTSFYPIAGILAAYLILGEIPTGPQYIGGAVILLGVFLSQFGISQHKVDKVKQVSPAMSDEGGFKGI
jgi:drug/metabolite transporter (DMT)-like permease